MATGREPFRAEKTVAVLKKISTDQPEAVRSVNCDVTKTLARIIQRLMAKDPAQRFSTAEEVEQVLTQYLAHLQQPRNQPKPKVKAVRKSSWLRVAVCTLALAAIVTAASWWWLIPRDAGVPSGLQNIDWQYELGELDREIGELESGRSVNDYESRDSFDDEAQRLQAELQRLEEDLNSNSIRKLR